MEQSPKSLADELRARSDEDLTRVLAARPDLAVPMPPDLSVLAARISAPPSAARGVERLDEMAAAVLDGLLLLDGRTSYVRLLELVGPSAPEEAVRRAVDHLRSVALVWGSDDDMQVVHGARSAVSPYLAGLGRPVAICLALHGSRQLGPVLAALGLPPARSAAAGIAAVAGLFAEARRLHELLAGAPPQATAALGELAQGPPIGTVTGALIPVPAAQAQSPIRWLLARGLLVAVDDRTVELPREVGLAVRGAAPLGQLRPEPPPLTTSTLRMRDVDAAAGPAAEATVRVVAQLIALWGPEPASVLRSGGLGVRELRRTARALDIPETTAALLVEVACAAGLVDSTADADPVWLPTPNADTWLAAPVERRWSVLASAWLAMAAAPGFVGERVDGGRAAAALSPDVSWLPGAASRRGALATLAGRRPGTAATPESVADVVGWHGPRRPAVLFRLVGWALAEAELLGVTGRGALSSPGRALLAGSPEAAATALADLLPPAVDHVLVQADLTVVAPGPLEPALARELDLVAEIESSGGATVYRVGEASVRRALDAGRSPAELHELFARRSRTPVPQALDYLIDDVARRHGVLRVGMATAYLRCDDEGLLAEVTASRRTSPLGLRRIAPSVVTSTAPVDRVLELLRSAGYAPVAESPDGAVVLTRRAVRRTPARLRAAHDPGPPQLDDSRLALLVRQMRAGDRAVQSGPGPGRRPGTTVGPRDASSTLALMRAAADEGRALWIGYVDAQGRASGRIVEPVAVEGGYVTAYDHYREEMRTFALHRITGIAETADPVDPDVPADPTDDRTPRETPA